MTTVTSKADTDTSGEEEDFRLYVFGILLITICFFGLVANSFTIFVLCRKEMRASIVWLIVGLLFCDSCYLICSLVIDGFPAMLDYLIGAEIYLPENSFAMEAAAQTGSIYFTIAISVERFIAVLYPIKARNLCTYFNSKMACIVVLVFSATLGLTYYCLYKRAYFIAGDVVLAAFQFILPISLLAFLNLSIYRAVKKTTAARPTLSQASGHSGADLSITKMLLAVVLVFAVTYIPLLMEFVFYHYNRSRRVLVENDSAELRDTILNSEWDYIPIVARLSVALNCSVNFIIYCVAGTRFRKVVVSICKQMSCSYPESCRSGSNAVRKSVRNLLRHGRKSSASASTNSTKC